ncbi:MAG TPA: hypothetical protein VNT32_01110 [Thermoleophilaceae bacterium]|nr:hypothetical protein [Thermoleophilaceae bacterium]
MGLVRSWIRGASTALGFSVALPAAILVAAAGVAVGGGGLGSLGSIGQLVTGPRAPDAGIGAIGGALAADPASLPGGLTELAGAGLGGGDAGERTDTPPGGGERDTPGRDREPRDPGDGPSPGPGPAPGPSDPGGGGGGPAPAGPVRQIGDVAKSVTDQLPGPIGPLAGGAVDEVVKAGEQLLAPAPRAVPLP